MALTERELLHTVDLAASAAAATRSLPDSAQGDAACFAGDWRPPGVTVAS